MKKIVSIFLSFLLLAVIPLSAAFTEAQPSDPQLDRKGFLSKKTASMEFTLWKNYSEYMDFTIFSSSNTSQDKDVQIESHRIEIQKLKKKKLYSFIGIGALTGLAAVFVYLAATHEPGERETQEGKTGTRGTKTGGKAVFIGGGLLCLGINVILFNSIKNHNKAIKAHEAEIEKLNKLQESLERSTFK
ncbi:MAG: hypothetical protein JXB26_04520 [Candidatus Aminicenantes bacterium]|nr:hypothetical protein [Candidatus Aminicenantes bacterium]